MKNLKLVILGCLVAYSIFLIVNFTLKRETTYELTENEVYEQTMLTAENKIENLSKKEMIEADEKCFDTVVSLKNYSLETYVKTNVSDTELLKKQYKSDKGLLSYYFNVVDECNLAEDEKLLIASMGYSSTIILESIYDEKITDYEFKIEDFLFKNIQGTIVPILGYQMSKLSEASSIVILLEILEDRYEENI